MINILLSVRRPFSEKILSGEKKWELRKMRHASTKATPSHCGSMNPASTGHGASSASAV